MLRVSLLCVLPITFSGIQNHTIQEPTISLFIVLNIEVDERNGKEFGSIVTLFVMPSLPLLINS